MLIKSENEFDVLLVLTTFYKNVKIKIKVYMLIP